MFVKYNWTIRILTNLSFDFRTENGRNDGDVPSLFASERVITLLAGRARSWRRAVARLTVLSRSSRKILNSTTARRAGESTRSARELRARKVILSFCCVAEIFQWPRNADPITFIDRPALSRTFSNRAIFLDRGERGLYSTDLQRTS